jgi:lysophospholipase L1-like esterase
MPDAAAPSLRILSLGDSYTIGEAVEEELRWSVQVARLLRSEGMKVADPVIIARTGWTTDELAQAIEVSGVTGTFDLVTLLAGVNDQYRGQPVAQYRTPLVGLLARARAFAGDEGARVLVLSIPDWGVTPFAAGRDRAQVAREIDAFNAVLREEALRAGAAFVDVTPLSRRAAADPSLVAPDGLHPSGEQYALWAREALPAARTILARP